MYYVLIHTYNAQIHIYSTPTHTRALQEVHGKMELKEVDVGAKNFEIRAY